MSQHLNDNASKSRGESLAIVDGAHDLAALENSAYLQPGRQGKGVSRQSPESGQGVGDVVRVLCQDARARGRATL